jgi:tetratricopeptide (TPR) repeat protein
MQLQRACAILILCSLFCIFPLASFAQEACAPQIDYRVEGEAFAKSGDYDAAIAAFTCAIESDPLDIDAYRGRIEARLMIGAYSDAMLDYADVKVQIVPENPDALEQILAYYQAALAEDAGNVALLSGYSFAQWYNFDYEGAIETLEQLLALDPDNFYGLTLHGNNEFFLGDQEAGEADFTRVLELAPDSADVYFIMADGYLYGLGDLENSLEAVTTATGMGLDTPRTDAILATCYFYMGDVEQALTYYAKHIERTSREAVAGEPLDQGESMSLTMIPGKTYHLPIEAEANETLTITVESVIESDGAMGEQNEVDSIMILLGADGLPVTGNDDNVGLNAGFEFTVTEAGEYTLVLGTFEGAGSGDVVLTRE